MNLTYSLRIEDMVAFQNYCGKHIPEAKRGRFYLRVVPALIVIAFVTMMTVNDNNFITVAAIITRIALLYMIFFPVIYRYLIEKNFNKQHKGNISESLNVIANETGILEFIPIKPSVSRE
jgi:predicted MFS family arabinose efflux permease